MTDEFTPTMQFRQVYCTRKEGTGLRYVGMVARFVKLQQLFVKDKRSVRPIHLKDPFEKEWRDVPLVREEITGE